MCIYIPHTHIHTHTCTCILTPRFPPHRQCIIINNRDLVRVLGRITKDIPISLHGANLLHAACRYGRVELVHLLIKKVPDIMFGITNEAYHALHIAVVHQHPDIIRALIQSHVTLSQTSVHRSSEIPRERERSMSESLPFTYLKFGDPTMSGHTVLHFAVALNNSEILKLLLKHHRKLRLNIEASKCGYTPLHLAVFLNHIEAARHLLKSGANPNTSLSPSPTVQLQNITSTVLGEAVINKNPDLLQLLIDFGGEDKCHDGLKICIPSAEHRDFIVPLLGSLIKCDDGIKVSKLVKKDRGIKTGIAEWSNIQLTEVDPSWIGCAILGCKFFKGQTIEREKAFDYITTINLSGNRLTWLPREVFQLPGLQILNVSSNRIATLPDLQQNFNGEKGVYEWPCTTLARLNLSKNSLTEVLPFIFKLPGLSHLDLSHNHLHSLPFDLWSAPKLYQVNCSNNRLDFIPTNWPDVLNTFRLHKPERVEAVHKQGSPAGIKRHTVHSHNEPGVMPKHVKMVPSKRSSYRGMTTSSVDHDIEEPAISKLQDHLNISNSNLPIEWGSEDSREEVYDGLAILNLSSNNIRDVPDNFPCLCPKLIRLDLSHNQIHLVSFPRQFPAQLKQLVLSHNPIEVLNSKECLTKPLPCTNPQVLAEMDMIYHDNVGFCSHRQHSQLNRLGVLELSNCQLREVNLYTQNMAIGRRRKKGRHSVEDPGHSSEQLHSSRQAQNLDKLVCPLLTRLILSHNSLEQVPESICDMVSLNSLDLSHNDIIELPAKLGKLCNLWEFPLDGLSLISPPHNIIERGKTRDIIGFLWSLLQR